MIEPLVSVIIPVYGVEKFIGKCASSLFEQTLSNVEYIFVNDCTGDKSIEVLNEIIKKYNKHENVVIINHEINKGLPAARNSGLEIVKGKYVFHCDGDDYLAHNALELLYQKAEDLEADIVWSDFYLTFENNERYMHQTLHESKDSYKSTEVLKRILDGSLKYNVWNKLIKRKLYKDFNIIFPEARNMGEDMTIIKLFVHAESIAYVPQALYHYIQTNTQAYTKSINEQKLRQIQENVLDLENYINLYSKVNLSEYIHFFKLNVKLPFLISDDISSYERWNNWFVESNSFIDRNINQSIRTRLLQKMALKRRYWLLRIYHVFIVKIFYGIIYR